MPPLKPLVYSISWKSFVKRYQIVTKNNFRYLRNQSAKNRQITFSLWTKWETLPSTCDNLPLPNESQNRHPLFMNQNKIAVSPSSASKLNSTAKCLSGALYTSGFSYYILCIYFFTICCRDVYITSMFIDVQCKSVIDCFEFECLFICKWDSCFPQLIF